MKQHICQHCSILFTPGVGCIGIFCSKSCNAKYHNSRREKSKPKLSKCKQCSKSIFYPNKFCSHSCSAVYNNKKRIKPIELKICIQCKKEFINKTKFCSKRCGWDHKKSTDSIFIKKAKRAETYKRYIARRKFQTPIDEDIKALQQFYINCPKGCEVDHIIPLSKGGAHSLCNLQYLSKDENRRKSNKLDWKQEIGVEPNVSRL